jgi:hypothetical protein
VTVSNLQKVNSWIRRYPLNLALADAYKVLDCAAQKEGHEGWIRGRLLGRWRTSVGF